ncbi:hypothetical protein ACGFMM_02055 [Streptomyces sp. NPDC048604]|uniref:hypothetical protein n=1 Tax=Streptomyces sp. NPDC048604 TaxID=3365578 RepID=UPI003721C00D
MLSEDLWERLNAPGFKARAYEESELPCPLDSDVDAALAALTDQREFELLARYTAKNAVGMFGMYAARMASLAVRLKEPEPVERGLLAYCLAHYSCNGKFYWTPPGPRLLRRACALLEVDAEKYFKGIPDLVPEYSRNALFAFFEQGGESSGVEGLLYVEGEDDGGFRFLRKPFTADWDG